ncbi:MAG: type II toxin-antitoxin system Phd/YefM family antitoxin [Acidobacteriota bacterium]|nr:type II toxin-antitoxin system Phd/YefM family antitoxin [Acidobacteriota bacterium]
MNASAFKEQCLAVLDQLEPDGLIITKRGKPVARLMPISGDCSELIGSMKGKVRIKGDLMSTGLSWSADAGKAD